MNSMKKLPKLYRKVYLELWWLEDEIQDGVHYQSEGIEYLPFMRAIDKKGNIFWKSMGENPRESVNFDKEDMDYDWHNKNLEAEVNKAKYLHNPDCSFKHTTILEQNELISLQFEWDVWAGIE